MVTIAIIIVCVALILGIAKFAFENAAKIVLILIVAVGGYVGWHLYMKANNTTPKELTQSLSSKGEKVFNKALDSVMGSVSSASNKVADTAKEKATEAKETAKKSIKKQVNKALD